VPGLDLKSRQDGNRFSVGLDNFRRNALAFAILRKQLEQGGVAQVLLKVSTMFEVFAVDLGHRQTVLPEVPREFKKRDILFANPIENADRALSLSGQPDDPATRPAQFALHWLDLFDRKMEVLLKLFLENVHAVADGAIFLY
jgi:hypothetical protein